MFRKLFRLLVSICLVFYSVLSPRFNPFKFTISYFIELLKVCAINAFKSSSFFKKLQSILENHFVLKLVLKLVVKLVGKLVVIIAIIISKFKRLVLDMIINHFSDTNLVLSIKCDIYMARFRVLALHMKKNDFISRLKFNK